MIQLYEAVTRLIGPFEGIRKANEGGFSKCYELHLFSFRLRKKVCSSSDGDFDVAALPGDAALRVLTCEAGSDEPKPWYCQSRRGRPKLQWVQCVFKSMLKENDI